MEEGTSKFWKQLKGKYVRVIINDGSRYPSHKDGVLIDVDSSHIFLQIDKEIKPILRSTIMRVDIRGEE